MIRILIALVLMSFSVKALAQKTIRVSDVLQTKLLIIIDKANPEDRSSNYRTAQTMTLEWYYRGELLKAYDGIKVSTGKNERVCPKNGECYDAITPTGRFQPDPNRRHEEYTSKSWEAEMPFAQFFYQGVAIHGITTQTQKNAMGTPASGACVRLDYREAELLFWDVHDVGPENTYIVVYDSSKGEDPTKYTKGLDFLPFDMR